MRPVRWIGPSLKDLRGFPEPVRRHIGRSLLVAQLGGADPSAKPLQGFGGASVMEIVSPFRTDAYRAVYTVQFDNAVYVLHVFQKKSKRGATTPLPDIELIRKRLRDARADYARRC